MPVAGFQRNSLIATKYGNLTRVHYCRKAIEFLALPEIPKAPIMKMYADIVCSLPPIQGYLEVLGIVAEVAQLFFTVSQLALFNANNKRKSHSGEVDTFLKAMGGGQWKCTAPHILPTRIAREIKVGNT